MTGIYSGKINRYKRKYGTWRKAIAAMSMALLTTSVAMAEGGGHAPQESIMYDPFVLTMLIIMLILLLAIGLLANVVLGAAGYFRQKEKDAEQKNAGSTTITALSVIALLFIAGPSLAQDANATAAAVQNASPYGGLSATTFYFMIGVIAIELLVVLILLFQLRVFLAKDRLRESVSAAKEYKLKKPRISVWNKLNSLNPIEQEAEIDLGHDYDGIRELDNRLPPWWLYGFYVTIIFAGVYLWRYHVSHTAPLSKEELQIAMNEADVQKALYLKKSANNVDENTVKLLTGTDVENGQKIFTQNCSPCHGKAGEGIVGPNLTDDYWLHGGNIKDVFKTIKYGWPEKGMRSWKDELSPIQIAQVASYIKSIHGTNPPNAKAKQGDLYEEQTSNNPGKGDSLNKKVPTITKK